MRAKLALALAVATLLAAPALAQKEPSAQPNPTADDAAFGEAIGTMGVNPETGAAALAGRDTDHPLYGVRGEQIVGQTLHGANGEEIGNIDNVVLSRAGGGGPAVVVGVGGFLGMGERDVAIPLDQIQVAPDGRLTTAMTREALGAMQPYAEDGYAPMDRARTLGEGMNP